MLKIADNIRRLRKTRGLTQEELAEKLHLTPQAVSRWETGKTMPDAERIIDLAAVLNCSSDEILGIKIK